MSKSIIDWELTVEYLNGNEAMAREIWSLFVKELPQFKTLVREACQSNDVVNLYKHLHKLHGSCCFVGVPALKEITKQFSLAAKANHQAEFPALLLAFNQVTEEVLQAAENFEFPAH